MPYRPERHGPVDLVQHQAEEAWQDVPAHLRMLCISAVRAVGKACDNATTDRDFQAVHRYLRGYVLRYPTDITLRHERDHV